MMMLLLLLLTTTMMMMMMMKYDESKRHHHQKEFSDKKQFDWKMCKRQAMLSMCFYGSSLTPFHSMFGSCCRCLTLPSSGMFAFEIE